MEGLNIRKLSTCDSWNALNLLAKVGDNEIMTQNVAKDSVAWLTPAEDPSGFEFYFILSGCVELGTDAEIKERLTAGECFTVHRLRETVLMKAVEDTTVLCVTNTPTYDRVDVWRETLSEQLRQIEEQDQYTETHSNAVLFYAVKLYEALQKPLHLELELDAFVVGALFHDVGKCMIPREILCKPAKLTDEEYAVIKKHPEESWNRLLPIFGERIAGLARMHHERLDGSGYPDGLCAEKIPPEVRILSVADAFDAMTRKRVYSNPRSMEEAAVELYNMPEKYDRRVTEKLLQMVRDGRMSHYMLIGK